MLLSDLPKRFQDKIAVDASTGCWLWTGSVHPTGYGRVRFGGKTEKAHRAVQMLAGVKLSPDMVTDHLCRVRKCVNPAHMEQVTNAENIQRGKASRLTCSRGHPFSGSNLRITKFKHYNMRVCRTCNAANAEKWRQRRDGVSS